MEFVFAFSGILIGGVIAFLFSSNKHKTSLLEQRKGFDNDISTLKNTIVELEKNKAVSDSELSALKLDLDEKVNLLESLNERLKKAENNEVKLKAENENFNEKSLQIEGMLKDLSSKYEKLNQAKQELEQKLIVQNEQNKTLSEKLDSERKQLTEIQEKFKAEFENLANKILQSNSREFSFSSGKAINELLSPLKEKLAGFEKKVEDTYDKGLKDRSELKNEVKRLYDLSLKLDEDARNLTSALKSDTKKQGNWGEVILERVLERSGLVKDSEYFLQQSARDDDGHLYRPDVIIKLPDEKHLIVDSKVSLTAYTKYVSEDDDKTREVALKQHLTSVRNHVKELSAKNYQDLGNFNTPDFVLMFMPIEPAFALAVQADAELFNYAWKERVVIVSPTTLLATLRTVASIWKYEKQNQNALEIAERGGKLYDKFVNFVKDLENIGSHLQRANKSYEEAQKKISSGAGNLIGQVEKLKKMGVSAKGSLPEKYLLDNE